MPTVTDNNATPLPLLLISILKKLTHDTPSKLAHPVSAQHCFREFYAIRAPAVSLEDYVVRLWMHFKCSEECFVIALIFLHRLSTNCPFLPVNVYGVHRLLCTALILAAKVHDDEYYSNAVYAKISGVHLKEMNSLERTFIRCIRWNFVVTPEEYNNSLKAMYREEMYIPERRVTKYVPKCEAPVAEAVVMAS